LTSRTILIAPDSFKGSLTSVEVARALGDGWLRAQPGDTVLLSPLADGGEGTLVAVEAAGGWEWHEVTATDPIDRPVRARWLRSSDGRRAVVELAEASGLSRLTPEERDPTGASTYGTGEVLRAVIESGVEQVTLGIGGSATTDGGFGILEALGVRRDPERDGYLHLDRLDALANIDLRVACDVSNPLLGEDGAAATYAPQKGATSDQVKELDAHLARYADQVAAVVGRDERSTSGAGAAGGVGFALLSIQDWFRSFALQPGVDLVMDLTDFDGKLEQADLVITGEGRVDAQTAFGKTALGVAYRASVADVPCVCVGGGVEVAGIEALAGLGVTVVPVVERPQSVEEAMAAGTAPLERCGERIARLIDLGATLTKSMD
jgi:glycerate kinase